MRHYDKLPVFAVVPASSTAVCKTLARFSKNTLRIFHSRLELGLSACPCAAVRAWLDMIKDLRFAVFVPSHPQLAIDDHVPNMPTIQAQDCRVDRSLPAPVNTGAHMSDYNDNLLGVSCFWTSKHFCGLLAASHLK